MYTGYLLRGLNRLWVTNREGSVSKVNSTEVRCRYGGTCAGYSRFIVLKETIGISVIVSDNRSDHIS